MMKKSTKSMNAVTLRIILSASLFLIIAIAAAIVYLANTQLREVATTVSHRVADAEASANAVQTLNKIEEKLAEEKDTIERVNSIVADSQSYQYQDQIIFDLNEYALIAGITITNLDFNAGDAATAPTPATPTPEAATPQPAASSGLKSTSVSVTLANPVDYNSLLHFIRLVEQNLTKMQISKVNLSKGSDSSEVTTETLTIEVYIQ